MLLQLLDQVVELLEIGGIILSPLFELGKPGWW